MIEVRVTLLDGSVCYVRIDIPNEIFSSEETTEEEICFISNWLRMNMKNVKEWSL